MWGKGVPGTGQKVQRPWGRNGLSRTSEHSDVAGERFAQGRVVDE